MRQHLGSWFWAIRPFSLSASAVPVLVGSMLAVHHGSFHAGLFVLVLLGSTLVQMGTNLVDEYADHEETRSEGKYLAPHKVIARGLLTSQAVRRGAMVCFGIAAAIGIYLVLRTGWPLALVCLASVAVAYGYSAGPLPLGTLGLGEPLVFIFMGPVMVLSAFYVQTHTLTWPVVWLSVPIGCLVMAILVVNNLRDIDEDRQYGKASLATIWGQRTAASVFCGLLVIAFGSVVMLVISGAGPWIWLAPLLTLPQALTLARQVLQGRERAVLQQALQGTASLHMYFGLFLAIAIV